MTTRDYRKFTVRLTAANLLKDVEKRALALHVSLHDLYEGPDRTQSVAAARRAVYLWLTREGKGINEIARLFDRAPSGIWKMTR